MVSDGTARPYRVKIKSPDYASLQAIDTPGRGYYIADVVAIIGSLDVVFEVSIDNWLCSDLYLANIQWNIQRTLDFALAQALEVTVRTSGGSKQ
jgi:hypothetical protein